MVKNNLHIFFKKYSFGFLIMVIMLLLTHPIYSQEDIRVLRTTQSWSPLTDPAVGSNYINCIVFANVYDSLVFPNNDGSVKPWLAEDWTLSEDGLTYTFALREGVKFHNGEELTSEDVIFSLQRLMDIGEGFGYLFIKHVEEAIAIGKYKVQIKIKEPFAPFLNVMVRLYVVNKKQVLENTREGIYGEFGDYGKEWLLTHDAGSGAYKFKEMNIAEHLLIEKFDEYWAGWDNEYAPQFVDIIGTTEPITIRTLMSRGELEITDQWQTPENLSTLAKLPGAEICALYEGSVLNVFLNTKKPPTDDIYFRKALAYSIDYEQLNKIVFPDSRRSGPVGLSTPGAHPNLQLPEKNLEKALEELKKSPYYEKLDQYPFELGWVSEVPAEEKLALMIQSNAAKIGIKVDIVKLPAITFRHNMTNIDTTPNGSVWYVAPHYAEAGSMLESRYHSSSCGTWEQGEWLQDPEIDRMIEDALSTISQEERFQKYYDIQEEILKIMPSLWIGESPARQVYRSDYVEIPAVEDTKQGNPVNPVMGYNWYYPDFKVVLDKAIPPYTPFNP